MREADDLLDRYAGHGATVDQIALVGEFLRLERDGKNYVGAILEVLSRERQHEIPDFIADFAEKMMARPSAVAAPRRQAPERAAPNGPLERWGYNGPVTARLPEKEWWPLRWSVLERDDFTCAYCQDRPERMCADHVVPLSRGGTNDPDNLVACCIPCNSSKADRLLSEWKGRWR